MTTSRRAAVPAGYGPEDWPDYDLGALRLSAPPTGALGLPDSGAAAPDAAFFTFPEGQVRVSVLAAPRGRPLWPDRAQEIAGQQAALGAEVKSLPGEWGPELAIAHGGESNWVIGVDGPRWMLLGRATWPADHGDPGLVDTMREMLRGTRVNRGDEPFPARAPLPLRHPAAAPEPVAEGRGPYAEPVTLLVPPRAALPEPAVPSEPAANGAPVAVAGRAAPGSVTALVDDRPSRTAGRGRAAALAAGTVLLLGAGAAALAMGITRPGADPGGGSDPVVASSAPNGGAPISGIPDAGRRAGPAPATGSAQDDAQPRPKQPRTDAGAPKAGTPGAPGGGVARQPAGGTAGPGDRPAPGGRHPAAPGQRKPTGGPAPARKPPVVPGGSAGGPAGGPAVAARGRTAPGGPTPGDAAGPRDAAPPADGAGPGDGAEPRDEVDSRRDDDTAHDDTGPDDTGPDDTAPDDTAPDTGEDDPRDVDPRDVDPRDDGDEPGPDAPERSDPRRPEREGPLGPAIPEVGDLLGLG